MPRVLVSETLQRSVYVDVSDEELLLLRSNVNHREDERQREEVRQRVMDEAGKQLSEAELEWVTTDCFDEEDNELFDIG